MSEILSVVAKLSIFTFIITSMLAMGMSLTISQIIAPLKNVKLVLLALLANFVLVPGLAYGLTLVIPLPDGLATGLIISGAAAGAPFLPKLVQLAKGNAALSVGMMTLLMVVTVFYLPFVLPFMLPGASVSPWDIAKSLILTMMLPLGIGLFIKARYAPTADHLQPDFSKISGVAIALGMVAILVMEFQTILATFGTGGILAAVLFLVGSLAIGMLLGSKERSTMGLGAAQRNLSAAMLVATQNFSEDQQVLGMVMVIGVLGLVLLGVVSGEMGKRSTAGSDTAAPAADDAQPASKA